MPFIKTTIKMYGITTFSVVLDGCKTWSVTLGQEQSCV